MNELLTLDTNEKLSAVQKNPNEVNHTQVFENQSNPVAHFKKNSISNKNPPYFSNEKITRQPQSETKGFGPNQPPLSRASIGRQLTIHFDSLNPRNSGTKPASVGIIENKRDSKYV